MLSAGYAAAEVRRQTTELLRAFFTAKDDTHSERITEFGCKPMFHVRFDFLSFFSFTFLFFRICSRTAEIRPCKYM
jgi:hypothetical protein